MVNIFWIFVLLGSFPSFLFCQSWEEIKVVAIIDQDKLFENEPLKGLISVTHPRQIPIAIKTFRLEGKPLQVDFIQEVEISPPNPLVIAYYRFKQPGQQAGVYLLPKISVEIGDKTYASIPVTYVVEATQKTSPSEKIENTKAFLKLELHIENEHKIYPGERFQIKYLYLFNQDIALTEETLPLLNPEGFTKIGSKRINSYQRDAVSIQEIVQTLEAQKPGSYSFPTSQITGLAYTSDMLGNQIYQKSPLTATSPPITLIISPFPEKEKPASFNGAIGPFDFFTSTLQSSSSLYVGDKLILDIAIGGKGQLDNVPLPELCCQPGFSGRFKLSDLPPVRKQIDQRQHFIVELRPLTESIKEIPSIEFSFFIPHEETYGILYSQPIPLKVNPLNIPKKEETSENSTQRDVEPSSTQVKKIEISGILPLRVSDLDNLPFSGWNILYGIPFGILWVILQIPLRREILLRRSHIKPKISFDYFQEAFQVPLDSPQCYHLLQKAFRIGLVEKQLIENEEQNLDLIGEIEIVKEIASFLNQMEKRRFTGQLQALNQEDTENAKKLFKKLQTQSPLKGEVLS